VPKSPLQTLDWLLIGAYFAMLFLIAGYYRRFAGRSLDEFFLGGRRNSGWSNGLAYAGAMMNADVAPAYSGFAVATGLFVCWFYLSRFGIALFIGAILFAVFWRRLNLFTTPEFYELRFGGTASHVIRSWVALKSSLLAMVAWTSTGLLAMHKIAGPILGFDSKTTTMLIVVPVVLTYVFLSGFAGSAATSTLHTLIMLIGSALLCAIVLWRFGGPVALANQLESAGGKEALQAMPPLRHDVLPLAAVLAWLIGTSIGYGGDTAPLGGAMEGQYLFSSKNVREASKMYVVAEVSLFLLLLLITLPSLAAMIHWPSLRLSSRDPNHLDREMAYGLIMSKYLPTGLLGLLFVGMLASVLSTIGGNLTFGSQILVSDIYRRHLRPHESEEHYVWAGRIASALILALALVVAYRVELIFDVAAFMVAASVAEMPANWAQWWWWRFNAWGRVAASFGGLFITVIVWFTPPTSSWPWWDRTYLVIGLNMLLTLFVCALTRPDAWPILERFFREALPLGAWGPVRDRVLSSALTNEAKADANLESRANGGGWLIIIGLALALVGAGSVMLLITGLSYLYVGFFARGVLLLAACLITGLLFFWSYGPYLSHLERRAPPRQLPATIPSHIPCSDSASEPLPTERLVAISMGIYGILIGAGALIWTHGEDLTLNIVAAVAFLLVAAFAWRLGRTVNSIERC
jgi:Na+/proline symporter